MDLNRIFGSFKRQIGSPVVITERVNPVNLPIVKYAYDSKFSRGRTLIEKITSSGFEIKQARYVLVKISEERKYGACLEDEKASYLVRISVGETHLGIAGSILDELLEKNPNVIPAIGQSAHHEAPTIARIKDVKCSKYVSIEGSGFIYVNEKNKVVVVYGRSAAFWIQYKRQINELLGMTGHEFVVKIIEAQLPYGWKCVAVNNNSQPILSDTGLGENYPVPPSVE